MTYSIGQELSASVPEEPPVKTAIVTANGNVFQSEVTPFGRRWLRATLMGSTNAHGDVYAIPWLELIAMHGPVTIIYLEN